MRISRNENIFSLDNGRISYIFSVEKNRYLMSRYFGRYIRSYAGSAKPFFFDRGFCSNPDPEDKSFSLDTLPCEYPDMNQGDFRSPAYVIQTEDGCRVTRFFINAMRFFQGNRSFQVFLLSIQKQTKKQKLYVLCWKMPRWMHRSDCIIRFSEIMM